MSRFFFYIALTVVFSSCYYHSSVLDAEAAFKSKQYAKAIPLLTKKYQKSSERREKGLWAYMLAESYRRTHQIDSAIEWYKKAQESNVGKETDLIFARLLKQKEEYREAAKAYRLAGRYAGNKNKYLREVLACKDAYNWLKSQDDSPYKIDEMTSFNTSNSDFSPQFWGDDMMIYTSERSSNEGDVYTWTNKSYFDLYAVSLPEMDDRKLPFSINTVFHQSHITAPKDTSFIIYNECGSDNKKKKADYCRLMMAVREGSTYGEAKAIDLGVDTFNVLHPHLSDDGTLLFFAIDDPNGFGGFDLYYSIKLKNETYGWSKPMNMGNRINTRENEVFPFVFADSLFFSSDGHPGMGGLDIFKSVKKTGRWQAVENLKAPINSGSDDFSFIIRNDSTSDAYSQSGFFSTNRLSSKGGDDIFAFTYFSPTPIEEDTAKKGYQIRLEGYVFTLDDTGVKVPLMGSSLDITSNDTSFIIGSDIDGSFFSDLKQQQTYDINVSKKGYFSALNTINTLDISTDSLDRDTTLYVEIILEKIQLNQEIVLDNIYYDLDESYIRDDAKPTLDSLVLLLKNNPSIQIELGSHTDCRGSNSYNQNLSQRRAQAAVDYLIQQGISTTRLEAKGYGETKPTNVCKCTDCSEDEHQQNRRTSFQVISQ